MIIGVDQLGYASRCGCRPSPYAVDSKLVVAVFRVATRPSRAQV